MTTAAARRSAWASNTLHGLDVLCRYLALNLLWAVSCALLVTAPAGTKAMLETAKEWTDGIEKPVLRTFAGHFSRTFLRTTGAAVPVVAAGLLLIFNFEVAAHTGDQRAVLMMALAAVAVPYLVFTSLLLPANIGHNDGLRSTYARTVGYIVTNTPVAAKCAAIIAVAAFIIYVQPYAVLVVAAPAARLIAGRSLKPIHTTAN